MRLSFLFILSALCLFACDFPGILNGSDPARQPTGDENATADTLLYVRITGGVAGVNQSLIVRESGLTSFTDSFRGNAEWRVKLTSDEISELKALMLTNGFLLLEESPYVDPQVADAFFYDIRFFSGEASHLVRTDDFGAPEKLSKIVEGIRDLVKSITQNGLRLELTLSAAEIEQGESLEFTLLVTNQSFDPITLKFDSGQIFDFSALRQGADALVWNWAHDQVFTQQLREIELDAGESRSYMVEWDGRDNDGEPVSGDLVIVGKLVSLPGGATPQKSLHISE